MSDCWFYNPIQYWDNGERDRQDYKVSRPCKRIKKTLECENRNCTCSNCKH